MNIWFRSKQKLILHDGSHLCEKMLPRRNNLQFLVLCLLPLVQTIEDRYILDKKWTANGSNLTVSCDYDNFELAVRSNTEYLDKPINVVLNSIWFDFRVDIIGAYIQLFGRKSHTRIVPFFILTAFTAITSEVFKK